MEIRQDPSGVHPEAAPRALRVLALEPYFGGSHRAFLEGWSRGSRHRFTLLTLPAHNWKWRMRYGSLELARQASQWGAGGSLGGSREEPFDVLFASSMLDLAAWRGLAAPALARLPALVYFHENQLTYPVRVEVERDLHFGFTNLSTALAANRVGWNSAFHRDDFLTACEKRWARLPDFRAGPWVELVRQRSRVLPPGIEVPSTPSENEPRRPSMGGGRKPGPLRIVWAARWEFDKNPEAFFEALAILAEGGVPFQVSVLGQSFRRVPEVFARARQELGERVVEWGFLPDREAYWSALRHSDVFVSTADHEFFGLAAAEAMALGCYPLFPDRLAYPELLARLPSGGDPAQWRAAHLYDDHPRSLAARLAALAARVGEGAQVWASDSHRRAVAEAVVPLRWPAARRRLDQALEETMGAHRESILEEAPPPVPDTF